MKIWESTASHVVHAVTKKPSWSLSVIIILILSMTWLASNLTIDASPDSLLLENDPDLKLYRAVHYEYGTDVYVIAAIQFNESVLSNNSKQLIKVITQNLKLIKGVTTVTSTTNIPLVYQASNSDEESLISFPTILSESIDKKITETELLTNPLYERNLISNDLKLAAFKIDFYEDPKYQLLFDKRYSLLEKKFTRTLNLNERRELYNINNNIDKLRSVDSERSRNILRQIRKILDELDADQTAYISGAPLIANDMKQYVLQDIKVFGILALACMAIVLLVIFHNVLWVLITLSCSFFNVLIVSGLISLFNFKLTIVSSNFVAILIIFSIAIGIHVVVRYQEEVNLQNSSDFKKKLCTSIEHISTPCLYMVLTSTIAFLSLIISDIKPVIVFGYIMVIGLCSSYVVSFTVLPLLIELFKPKTKPLHEHYSNDVLHNFLSYVLKHQMLIMILLIAGLILSAVGISKITVENRFIDYFKKSTDIHQGLAIIDQNLGGTVPIEIILNAPVKTSEINETNEEMEEEFMDYLAELEETQGGYTTQSHWYNRLGIKKIQSVHKYLETYPQIGKVLSLSSTEYIFQHILNDKYLDDFQLSLIYSKLPEETLPILIDPYLSDDGNQARIVARLKDSDRTLVRNDLLQKINFDLTTKYAEKYNSEIKVVGIGVLYNNVLQSLYRSQILTLGFVFISIFIMLSILFQSLKYAFIAILPNIFTALLILGMMGLMNIPLNIMTITIAAITIGIGVDDEIHYIHRYKKEFIVRNNVNDALLNTHVTVGKALWFTSLTVAAGFILLIFSNFTPTIYFGIFTCFAMLISIAATFTVIPLALSFSDKISVRLNS